MALQLAFDNYWALLPPTKTRLPTKPRLHSCSCMLSCLALLRIRGSLLLRSEEACIAASQLLAHRLCQILYRINQKLRASHQPAAERRHRRRVVPPAAQRAARRAAPQAARRPAQPQQPAAGRKSAAAGLAAPRPARRAALRVAPAQLAIRARQAMRGRPPACEHGDCNELTGANTAASSAEKFRATAHAAAMSRKSVRLQRKQLSGDVRDHVDQASATRGNAARMQMRPLGRRNV